MDTESRIKQATAEALRLLKEDPLAYQKVIDLLNEAAPMSPRDAVQAMRKKREADGRE